jgi:hypothetical protein
MSKKMLQAAAGNAGETLGYVEDVFSTYLYDGNGTSQTIENGINLSDANVGGSGFVNGLGSRLTTTESLGSGDFTVEFWAYTINAQDDAFFDTRGGNLSATGLTFTAIDSDTVRIFDNGVRLTVNGISYLNQWVHFAVERSSGTITIYVNGTSGGSVANTNNYSDTSFKIGDSPHYGDTDAYISNFRLVKGSAVYGGNFTPSTAPLTAISGTALLTLQSPEPFTDNSGNSLAITQAGNVKAKNFGPFTADEAGAGGLVWLKGRDVADQHFQFDTERGTGPYLVSNSSAAEVTDAGFHISSYNANGFSLQGNGTGTNNTSYDYTSWTFRKAEKFFDVVTYTGNGSNRTINHSLGSVPAVMIVKCYSGRTDSWIVYHSSRGANEYAKLDTTNSFYTGAAAATTWNQTAPTDSVFTVGTDGGVNQNGVSYVAYLFASDAGGFGDDGSENIIKCGSYTGTGSAGLEVALGFEPQWVLIKRADSTGGWPLEDTMRGMSLTAAHYFFANLSAEEQVSSSTPTIYSNATGFTVNTTTTGYNASGGNYIYIAIRRPMKTPESGTEVFQTLTYSGSGGDITRDTNITVDALFTQRPTGGVPYALDRLRDATRYISTSSAAVEGTQGTAITEMGNDYLKMGGGAIVNSSGSNYALQLFKRATGFMDVVAYTGNGTAGRTVAHSLGVAPELMIFKNRSQNGDNWVVYSDVFSPANYLKLNDDSYAVSDSANLRFNNTAPTESVFTVGTSIETNWNGQNYISYHFATLDGVSKVGSFTGQASGNLNVDCGFAAGCRFVLIKRTDSTGDWWVFDSARGITVGNDPRLALNSSSAETSTGDFLYNYSAGFVIEEGTSNVVSGGNYIFLAIA